MSLACIGDVASVAGLFVGIVGFIWVLCNIKNIEKKFFTKARLPESLKALKNIHSELVRLLRKPEEKNEILATLGKIDSKLESIKNKVDNPQIQKIQNLRKLISTAKSNAEERLVRDVQVELDAFISTLEDFLKDKEWRP